MFLSDQVGFSFRRICLLSLIGFIASSTASATKIEFEAMNLPDTVAGQDLWSYQYFVSDRSFSRDQGFTTVFDRHLYTDLLSPPPVVNADWNAITLQPDPNLPDDGAYDALALVNGASLADPFTVDFVFPGVGQPGPQPFTINQFDSAGQFVSVLETGVTVPRLAAIPEPRAIAMVLLGLAILPALARRRSATQSTESLINN